MSPTRKFMFDTPLDAAALREAARQAAEAAAAVITDEDLARAHREGRAEGKAEGYEEGRAAGRAETLADAERAILETAERIAARLDEIATARDEAAAVLERNAVALAAAIARKITGGLMAEIAAERIEAAVRQCLGELCDAPRVVIRLGGAAHEALQQRIIEAASQTGFRGEVVVQPEPALEETDCRIEWADGGADFSIARLWTDIDAMLGAYHDGGADDEAQISH
jgi:flagellar assembly protein FliH